MEEKKEEDEDQQNSQKHFECLSDVSWKPFGGLFGRLGGSLGGQDLAGHLASASVNDIAREVELGLAPAFF